MDFISDKSIEEGVKLPAKRLIELFKSGLLNTIENILPDNVIKSLINESPNHEDISQKLEEFFSRYPRKKSSDPNHDRFHDVIDILNLELSYDLSIIYDKKFPQYCSPFITHTNRVFSAGKKVFKEYTFLIQRSIVPLYLSIGFTKVGKNKINTFFNRCYYNLKSVQEELEEMEIIQKLNRMTKKEREQRFNQNNFVLVNDLIVKLFKDFRRDLYEHSINGQRLPETTYSSKEELIIENYGDLKKYLYDRLEKARQASRDAASEVKKFIDYNFDDGLAGLYSPDCSWARDLTDWIKNA